MSGQEQFPPIASGVREKKPYEMGNFFAGQERGRKYLDITEPENQALRDSLRQEIVRRKQAEWEARHDQMTRQKNRRGFHEHVPIWLEDVEDESIIAMTMIDIDGFKEINDEYGHDLGDEVLIVVAYFIEEDNLEGINARFGGDELAQARKTNLYLDHKAYSNDLRSRVLTRIKSREALEEASESLGFPISDQLFSVLQGLSFSVGAGFVNTADAKESEKALWGGLKTADARMYTDKGRPGPSNIG